MESFDLVVIGGGSAGLKAARTAAKRGARVALAEERELGGECFWAGCVPTKAMVRAAEVWHLVRRAKEFGIHVEVTRADFAEAMAYKDRAVAQVGGEGEPDAGLGRMGVRYYPKHASFEEPHILRIGDETVHADRVILANGTMPAVPPIPGLEGTGYLTNREAVSLTSLPRSLIVLGAGPIGLEFGQVFRRFGAEVTVVEIAGQILPNEDADIAELVAGYLRNEGIHIRLHASAMEVRKTTGGKQVIIRTDTDVETLEVEEILVATGRYVAVEGLNLEAAGVDYTRRAITVDRFLRTNQPHIWAAGDANGGYLFTHVASFEGGLAAENAFGAAPKPADTYVVPRTTFVDPEVASIGYTEAGALAAGLDIVTHSFSFADLDRAILHGEARGLVKLVVEAHTGQIVGAHLVGPHASSILAEIALAMQHHLPVSAIAETMHAYPTFPEAVEAAALAPPSSD